MIRGTLALQNFTRFLGDTLFDCSHDARFANARFSAKQQHLARSLLGLRPALDQKPELMRSSDQWRQASSTGRVETASGVALARDLVDVQGG